MQVFREHPVKSTPVDLALQRRRARNLELSNRSRKEWMLRHGPCRICGSMERLELDHIDPATKDKSIKIWNLCPQNPKRISEVAKCQVLCHSCHKAKTKAERIAKAGSK